MFNQLKKNKKILMIVGILSGISLIFILGSVKPSQQPNPNNPTPNTSPTITNDKIEIISYFPPKKSVSALAFPNTALVFELNKPITQNQITFNINPTTNINIYLGDSGKRISISPQDPWELKTEYTIKLEIKNGPIFENTFQFISPSEEKYTVPKNQGGI